MKSTITHRQLVNLGFPQSVIFQHLGKGTEVPNPLRSDLKITVYPLESIKILENLGFAAQYPWTGHPLCAGLPPAEIGHPAWISKGRAIARGWLTRSDLGYGQAASEEATLYPLFWVEALELQAHAWRLPGLKSRESSPGLSRADLELAFERGIEQLRSGEWTLPDRRGAVSMRDGNIHLKESPVRRDRKQMSFTGGATQAASLLTLHSPLWVAYAASPSVLKVLTADPERREQFRLAEVALLSVLAAAYPLLSDTFSDLVARRHAGLIAPHKLTGPVGVQVRAGIR